MTMRIQNLSLTVIFTWRTIRPMIENLIPHIKSKLLIAVLALSTCTMITLQTVTIFAAQQEPNVPAWDNTLRRIHVPILMYHYVSPIPQDADDVRINLTVEPEVFRTHIDYMKQAGYTSLSLYELHRALLDGTPLPSQPVVITFDDSYIDHYTYVFPLLKQYGFTATFFVITGLSDANNPGHLSWAQIREMAQAGMSMESHTKNHQDLRQRDRDFLVYEILGSMESIAAHIGLNTHMFSYPVGRYDTTTLSVIHESPVWRAVTTQHGALHTTDNTLEMPRIRIHGNASVGELAALLRTRQ
jgi:peptidoglycan/xylan/chitin deacetylase (PgdA/CDA1 family)